LICENCGKELDEGELYCTKCNVNTDEVQEPQKPQKEDVRRDKLCAFAALLFLLSGVSLLIAQIKDWHDFGIRIQDAYFFTSVCFAAVLVFACLNIYNPVKLKRILKILSIVLAAEILWGLYDIVSLAVKAASDSVAGVSVAVIATLLPSFIYSLLLLAYITGLLKVKSVLRLILIIRLLFWSATPIIYFLGSAYMPDFKMNFFETMSNFFNSVPASVATLIFISVLPYKKARFIKFLNAGM
jgi:hypothetical protein